MSCTVRHCQRLAATLAVVAAGASLAPQAAAAQDTREGMRPYRFTVAPFLAQQWFDPDGAAGREAIGGYGLRVMFNRSDAAEATRSLLGRSSVGVYGSVTSSQKGLGSTQQLGGQLDVSLFPEARYRNALDPLVSLGAGVLRARVAGGSRQTDFAVTPGVGTRFSLFPGVGLRGDLRAPVILGSNTRVNFATEGGFFFSF